MVRICLLVFVVCSLVVTAALEARLGLAIQVDRQMERSTPSASSFGTALDEHERHPDLWAAKPVVAPVGTEPAPGQTALGQRERYPSWAATELPSTEATAPTGIQAALDQHERHPTLH